MGLKSFIFKLLIVTLGVTIFQSCAPKKSESDIEVVFNLDTLHLGYTYWWSETKPFKASCENKHSLVFSGTVRQLEEPNNDPGPLYTAQNGIIEIERLFKIKQLPENTYANQKYITTDCFYGSGLAIGDTVLVFSYDYEGDYSIPGNDCILKINGFDDPIITSIRKFIDAKDHTEVLEDDLHLWKAYGLDQQLQGSIANCIINDISS